MYWNPRNGTMATTNKFTKNASTNSQMWWEKLKYCRTETWEYVTNIEFATKMALVCFSVNSTLQVTVWVKRLRGLFSLSLSHIFLSLSHSHFRSLSFSVSPSLLFSISLFHRLIRSRYFFSFCELSPFSSKGIPKSVGCVCGTKDAHIASSDEINILCEHIWMTANGGYNGWMRVMEFRYIFLFC